MSPGPDDGDGLRTDGPRPDGLRTDGLPTLPTGEPVLHRWFVLTMLALAPVAIGVTAWALLSIPSGDLPPAERRPPGGPEVTIARGDIALATSDDTEAGPACAEGVTLVGDSGSRAAGRRALGATCQLIARGDLPRAAQGLEEWLAAGAVLRMGTFEFSGVESSARIEDGRMIVELNAKFIFDDATRAAPALLHQLVLIADGGWPGATVSAASELEAARVQATACGRLSFGGARPRGCLDVDELLALDDPLAAIAAAGFRTS
ncbi:MAG: hypothetical protein WD041_02880 [Nitriliruptoraceae bacterium]